MAFAPLGAIATLAARRWGAPADAQATAPVAPPPPPADDPVEPPVAAAELPIDGYDHLAASQVVDRLAALTPAELDAVAGYERANRHRQSVLAKIDQLR